MEGLEARCCVARGWALMCHSRRTAAAARLLGCTCPHRHLCGSLTCALQQGQEQLVLTIWKEKEQSRRQAEGGTRMGALTQHLLGPFTVCFWARAAVPKEL